MVLVCLSLERVNFEYCYGGGVSFVMLQRSYLFSLHFLFVPIFSQDCSCLLPAELAAEISCLVDFNVRQLHCFSYGGLSEAILSLSAVYILVYISF